MFTVLEAFDACVIVAAAEHVVTVRSFVELVFNCEFPVSVAVQAGSSIAHNGENLLLSGIADVFVVGGRIGVGPRIVLCQAGSTRRRCSCNISSFA